MNLIFDFDGTIADSLDKGIAVVNKLLLEKRKSPITKKEVRNLGISHITKTREISKMNTFLLLLNARKEISKHIEELETFDRLPRIVEKLAVENKLGIISSNSTHNIKRFLKKHAMLDHFSFINDEKDWFGKDKKIKKIMKNYALSPDQTMYIGDEGRDIVAANKAGIKSVAVTWGFESEKVLVNYSPDVIINKPDQLLKLKLD